MEPARVTPVGLAEAIPSRDGLFGLLALLVRKLQMTVLVAVDEGYVNNLSAQLCKGSKARAEAGVWLGEVPFGYEGDCKKDGGNGMAYGNE